MDNIKNNEELKDNNKKGKISEAKSIIFLPFDLNVSNPEITNPYTRISSENSPGKRNKLSDILKEPNEKVKDFKDAINKDNFQAADSIIDTSKYLDFIANNFNYKKNIEAKIGFLDWYEKIGNNQKYILPINEPGSKNIFETQTEFKIEKFGIILNELARSGSILIEIKWTGDENKLELLSKIDFFRYHDKDKAKIIEEIKKTKTDFNYKLSEEISQFITVKKPKEINTNSVELIVDVNLNETEIAEMGFCCLKNNPPTISDRVDNPINNKHPKNILKKVVGDLVQNTTYYYCAYFKDKNEKISYGSVHSFTTSSNKEENKKTNISDIIKVHYTAIYNLIYFNHVKPTVVHLIHDSQAFEIEDEKMSELIYKTLRIPAKPTNSNISHKINYNEIVKLQSPDENISFATMNEGVLIIDNTIDLNALTKKYLPAFVLALNQREFLLKVIRLAPYVDITELKELKDLKKFVTEVYLKQISFTVSVYNEIDILFVELQKKFDIEILMRDNKESINEIHQLIEGLDKEDKAKKLGELEDAQKKRDNNLGLILSLVGLFGAASAVIDLYNFYHNPDSIAFWWLPYSVIFSFGAYLVWFYKRKK